MPFDFEEYRSKCSNLSPEELQKEWENYTRHIAGGATSTAGSVLFAPFTAGASLVGLGLSTPRIHNARKKRAIIEEQLQAHGTTHHTRKRDVVAPMAVAGTIGGLTLGFAGAGADLLGGQAAEKGMEYFVSHAALEVAGSTLEHKHDEGKKTKDQLELAQRYGPGAVERPNDDQKQNLLSPQTSLRKSKSDTHIDGLAYGSLPGEKRPKKSKRPSQVSQPFQTSSSARVDVPTPLKIEPISPIPQKESQIPSNPASNAINVSSLGLPDHDEAERRGLRWDPSRGIYVRSERLNTPPTENPLSPNAISPTDTKTSKPSSDELEDLLSELLVGNSASLRESDNVKRPRIAAENTGDPSTPLSTSRPALLLPDEKAPSLPPRPQSIVLPPRPNSAIGSYMTPNSESARPQRYSYVPPPPPPFQPPSPIKQEAVIIPQPPQKTSQHLYNPQHLPPSPSLSPALLPTQTPYQPAHIQFPQYQHYPPPPPNRIPPPPAPRPSPQPLQQRQNGQLRQGSTSSISTVSSASTSHSFASTLTVSALSTPLTGYSTTVALTPVSSESRIMNTCDASPKPMSTKMCASPAPAVSNMYFPPPPTVGAGVPEGDKKWRR